MIDQRCDHRRVALNRCLGVPQWGDSIANDESDAAGAGPDPRLQCRIVAATLAAPPSVAGCGTLAAILCQPTSPGGYRRQRLRRAPRCPRKRLYQPRQTSTRLNPFAVCPLIVAGARSRATFGDERRSRVDRGADRHHRPCYTCWRAATRGSADGHRRVQRCSSPDDLVEPARSPGVQLRRRVVDLRT